LKFSEIDVPRIARFLAACSTANIWRSVYSGADSVFLLKLWHPVTNVLAACFANLSGNGDFFHLVNDQITVGSSAWRGEADILPNITTFFPVSTAHASQNDDRRQSEALTGKDYRW